MNLRKIVDKVFSISAFAFFATLTVYFLIISTLNQGISCDEGFYLMGYLHQQSLGSFISDYANIVRTITPQGWEENIMVYRYERLILFLISIVLFAVSLYKWLKQEYTVLVDKILFFSLVLLSGALSYTFASPTISYDSIQTIVYLLAFSFLFWAETSTKRGLANVFYLISGAVSIIGVLNYFPSGLFLIGLIGVWIFLRSDTGKLQKLFVFGMGIGSSLALYHFLVRDLIEYAGSAFDTIVKVFTEKSASRHDSAGLIKSFAVRFGWFMVYIPVVYLFTLLLKKVKFNKTSPLILLVAILLFLLLYRKIYAIYAPIFFIPIALLFAQLIIEKTFSLKNTSERRDLILIVLLILLPFFGVLGTNQNMYAKMLIFMPFWLIVFFIFLFKVKQQYVAQASVLLMTVLLFAGYVYLGNFSRYHYYYTPRSSRYSIKNIEREQKVTVSRYQQEYYGELADTLKANGAGKGDAYLAFGENQMTVYLMGGYIVGNLSYHWFQYKFDNLLAERPKFFILFKNEEQNVISLLKDTRWNFPQAYNRWEMRAMSENMDQEKLKTVIYALKE